MATKKQEKPILFLVSLLYIAISGLLRRKAGSHAKRSTCALIATVFILSIVVPSLFWSQKASAAATFVNAASTANNIASSTITIAKPTSTAEGDFLLVNLTAVGAVTFSASTGCSPSCGTWTSVVRTPNGTGMNIETFRHVAGPNEPASYVFNLSSSVKSAGGISAYRGVDTTGANGANGIDLSGGANTGNSTTPATLLTTGSTTVANEIVVPMFGIVVNNTGLSTNTLITPTDTQRFRVGTNCGLTCTDVAATGAETTQATTGTVAAKTATSNISGLWAAHVVVLKLAGTPTYSISAYRWFDDIDSPDLIGITNNVTAGDDQVNATAVDPTGGYVYLAGYDSGGASSTPEWHIEKRRISNGSLVLQFNSTGQLTEDVPNSTDEKINAMAIDVSGGYMYLAGYDKAGGNSSKQWRMEKRSLTDGTLAWSQVSDPGTAAGADDFATSIAIDTAGGSLYVAGRDSGNAGQWRVEKRNLSNGNSDAIFTTVVEDLSSGKDEYINAIVLDIGNGNMYVNGFDGSPNGANSSAWRVEKRSMSTGALGSGFGNLASGNCATGTAGTAGIYCIDPQTAGGSDDRGVSLAIDSNFLFISGIDTGGGGQWRVDRILLGSNSIVSPLFTENPTAGDDSIKTMASDGTYIYLVGYDSSGGTQWRIEKRTVNGGLASGFGNVAPCATVGVQCSDPTSGSDEPSSLALDTSGGFLYAGGFDSTGSNEWRLEKRNLTSGSGTFTPTALAPLNTAYAATPQQIVRLRLLLNIAGADFWPSAGQLFKLQVAPKSGTCDTAYSGEIFTDISAASGPVRFFDNPSITNGANTVAFTGNDPTDGANTITLQTFVEANNFTNSLGIVLGSDGLWDFAIADNDLPPSAFGAYCFRVVDSLGNVIATPTQVPELNYCSRPPTRARLRQFKYFCNEQIRPFYWSVP